MSRLATLRPLLLPVGLLASLLAAGAAGAQVRVLTLPNGAEAVLAPGPGPNRLVVELAVGPADDPPELPGVSLLAARALLLGTLAHPTSEQLEKQLEGAAGAWSSGLEGAATRLVLEDVRDWTSALEQVVEILAEPRFPAGETLRLRLDLAAEATEAGEERGARDAAALLLPAARRPPDAFSLLSIEQADLRALHARAYGADRVRAVLQGELPEPDSLDGLLLRTLGTWVGSRSATTTGEPGAPPPGPEHRPTHVVHGGVPGLDAAFPAPARAAEGALALAALAERLGEGWSLPDGVAELGLRPGQVAGLRYRGPAAESALVRLEKELSRLARRGPRARDLRAARAALAGDGSPPSAAALLAVAPRGTPSADLVVAELERPVEGFLAGLQDSAVSEAGRALAEGPRALVVGFAGEEAARRLAEARGGAVLRGAGEPLDAVARELEREGRRRVATACEAHGGAAFRSLERITVLGERALQMGSAERVAGLSRLDVDLRNLEARQETRPRSQRTGDHVVVFDGERALRMMNQGALDQGALGSMSFRSTLLRTPLVALHRACTGDDPVRSRGRTEVAGRPALEVEVADTRAGLSRLAFDAETGLLLRVAYRNRLPFRSEPMELQLLLSEHSEQGGVVVYGTERLTLGGETERSNAWRNLTWSFRTDVPSPRTLLTDPNELGRVRQD